MVLRCVQCFMLAVLLAATACFDTHDCEVERCDGRDNDCDGRIDESFRDSHGRYSSLEHCGACGLSCAEVFPSAAERSCGLHGDNRACELLSCGAGKIDVGGACAAEPFSLCLPCTGHQDCSRLRAGARCLSSPNSDGVEKFCGQPCSEQASCPSGSHCVTTTLDTASQCWPDSGSCACPGDNTVNVPMTLACELKNSSGDICVAARSCNSSGRGRCESVLVEACNGSDDDCDDLVDEGFVDDQGRYATEAHCGGCGRACQPPGPNMGAECRANATTGVRCEVRCLDGFVDVDGLAATGCECELQSGAVVTVGADADCDGVVDPTPGFVFVSIAGDDANSGTEADAPLRTLSAGFALSLQLNRAMLVARGPYQGPFELASGVAVYGGYSPDFRSRDRALYPVVLEASDGGGPALVARNIAAPTVLDGVTISGSSGEAAGQGSTALWLDRSGAALSLHEVTVIAGAGSAGTEGRASSERLGLWGLSSLADLTGESGERGLDGGSANAPCSYFELLPGAGGGKTCPAGDVSGGSGGGSLCTSLPQCSNGGGVPCGNAGCTDFTNGGGCDLVEAKAVATANPSALPGRGAQGGGAGELTYSAPTNRGSCSFCDDNPTLPRLGADGAAGALGQDGNAGMAQCNGPSSWVVDSSGRLRAAQGADGRPGLDGSGGGGGSGGAGYSVIANTAGACNSAAGGSGGGGGSGGCGAPGAGGGSGGGLSIGVLITLPGDGTGPSMDGVRVVTAAGGDGGQGGEGAAGGQGGTGGGAGNSAFWCARNGGSGGAGGDGGAGGGGAGGCGGSSLGIYVDGGSASDQEAYRDQLLPGLQIDLLGTGGRAGKGGSSPGSTGSAGVMGAERKIALSSG